MNLLAGLLQDYTACALHPSALRPCVDRGTDLHVLPIEAELRRSWYGHVYLPDLGAWPRR